MKLLVIEWGAYTQPDINSYLDKYHIDYKIISYYFEDKNEDPVFLQYLLTLLNDSDFNAVFSVNYFPLVAQACYQAGIKYLSWGYDNPLNVQNIELTLGLPTNYVFLFDKIQVKGYRDKGFQNVFHLPLAINAERLNSISLSMNESSPYRSEISFVGNIYQTSLDDYMSAMDEYCKGYINSICDVQLKIYGTYLIDEMLTIEFLDRVNNHYRSLKPDTAFQLSKEALSYACAAQVTKKERLLLLSLLSNHFRVKLYSHETNPLLKNTQYMGSCDYLSEMPKVFLASDINLNITLKINQTGIPLRALDILGCGGFLLSNFQEELADNFINEKEVVLYESIEDAYAKTAYYLKHPDLRKKIAQNGCLKAREQFHYKKQLKELFEKAGIDI